MTYEFYITDQHPLGAGEWTLCSTDGRVVEKCGFNDGGYLTAVRSLVASADGQAITAAADSGDLVPWDSDPAVAYINVETSDHRIFEQFSFRQFPMPLLAQTTTQMGHDGAYICGRVDAGSVEGDNVLMNGVFNDDDESIEVAGLVGEQMLRTVSVDMADITMETKVLETDDEGWPTEWQYVYHEATIAALTLTPVSAFADARIKIADGVDVEAIDQEVDVEPAAAAAAAVVEPPAAAAAAVATSADDDKKFSPRVFIINASGADIPVDPPLEWFDQPNFQNLTRWTVDDSGRVFGHLAPWGQCHIGVQDRCVIAPKSLTAYGFYKLGRIQCEEGCQIDIGTITMGTGHANKRATARAAAEHYDNTGTGIADVTVGEDQFGIWVAGALRPELSRAQIREARAAKLSGDWRGLNGNLELVATLAVNVPGFPTYDEYVGASGNTETLIASLMPMGDLPARQPRDDGLRKQVDFLTGLMKPQLDDHVERLRARVHVS
jgi:hypothetical protein